VKFPLVENGKGPRRSTIQWSPTWLPSAWHRLTLRMSGDVAGTNKKPWRQKDRRARAGLVPVTPVRGGGVVFGPKPRDFTKKISRHHQAACLAQGYVERLRAGDVLLVDDLKLGSAKTKEFVSVLSALDLKGTALIVAHVADKNLMLATRKCPRWR